VQIFGSNKNRESYRIGESPQQPGQATGKAPRSVQTDLFYKLLPVKLAVNRVKYPNEIYKVFLFRTEKALYFFDWEKWICWDMNWEARV
jgi:hypothetical protein